jgi:hypothetical protein
MAFKDWLSLTKTILNLTDDLKKSREEIKTLSSQVNALIHELLELKTNFKNFSEKEFSAFTEQEILRRENFSQTERHEREKFRREVESIFEKAENAYLRRQLEEHSKPATGKGSRKQVADGRTKPQNKGD